LQAFVLKDLFRLAQDRNVNPKAFFDELRRRDVYKVTIAYAVTGWVIAFKRKKGEPKK
jgi:hypothetical protein